MFAMGCEAALKPVTLAVSGTPRRPSLLPVPGSSRTSPLPHKRSVARFAHRPTYNAETSESTAHKFHRCNTNCPTNRTACSSLSCMVMQVCKVRRARPRRW
ncbi:hypothetical protein BKM03_28655 [Pseudomonas avellanae]|uniref:Uncharacterized protein n=1 Tax=Pseudomonas avellanae TaxID=46257 RepID=A0AAD0GT18_9PSED|nr:hypothetical protein BKM03_28655 [Pseudomonas avellanae]POP84933.1 hypothetical protein CXB34_19430 [Pseudomonas amygdali pv. morsprunorum]